VWGAAQGDALAGFVAFREGWIHQFYVLPNQQRRGLGSALLRVAKSASSSLSLWTFWRNMLARWFYEARGFVVIKMTDGTDNEELEPDVLYRWDNQMPLSSDFAL
jgi:putative acetyltransferase